jgi:site-specific DNA recombinase
MARYGRVSAEDHQDPVTSLARQREQAAALVAGQGQIVAEFFDIGQSRTLAWARRPPGRDTSRGVGRTPGAGGTPS